MEDGGFLRRIRKLVTPLKSLGKHAVPGAERLSQQHARPMKIDAVSRVYAHALFELGLESNSLDDLAQQVNRIGGLLDTHPDLLTLLETPAINKRERAEVITRIFEGRCSDTVFKFLRVLSDRGRLGSLRGVIAAFNQRMDEHHGVVEVDAWVAEELSSSEADRVARTIGEHLGKKVVLRQSVDPELIGGLKLKIGDRLIDGSVATQLRMMKRQLSAAGLEKARSM